MDRVRVRVRVRVRRRVRIRVRVRVRRKVDSRINLGKHAGPDLLRREQR